MFLTYSDLVTLFPNTTGIRDDFTFHCVATKASFSQPRGLFIPLLEDSGEIKEAIANGAIGMIWLNQKELPSYLPNHFPVFYSSDMKVALEKIVETYLEKLNGEKYQTMNMTKFLFSEEKLLKDIISSYDKPVLKIISKYKRRG